MSSVTERIKLISQGTTVLDFMKPNSCLENTELDALTRGTQ